MLSTKLFSQKQMDLFLSCTAVKGGKGGISLSPWDTVQKCSTDKKQTNKKTHTLLFRPPVMEPSKVLPGKAGKCDCSWEEQPES